MAEGPLKNFRRQAGTSHPEKHHMGHTLSFDLSGEA